MLLAAQRGDTEEVSALVDGGADMSAVNEFGMTPLHYAAMMHDGEKMAEVLLKTVVNVEARNYKGQTALHCAGANTYTSTKHVFRLLLEAGANVAAKTNDGATALHYAAENVPLHRCVAKLLELGADVSAADKDGETALHRACLRGRPFLPPGQRSTGVVRLLVHAGADLGAKNKRGQTPLHSASDRYFGGSSVEVLHFLLNQGSDVQARDSDGRTPLHLAVASGYVTYADESGDFAKVLLDAGVGASTQDDSGVAPLHTAASRGDKTHARVLLDAGANVAATDIDGDTALHCAAYMGHMELSQMLLAAGANSESLNTDGETAEDRCRVFECGVSRKMKLKVHPPRTIGLLVLSGDFAVPGVIQTLQAPVPRLETLLIKSGSGLRR